VCCSVLQCVAVCCSISFGEQLHIMYSGVLQHLCVCVTQTHVDHFLSGSVLQCVAVCSRVFQSVAVCCSVVQCVAVCCSVRLPRVAS